MITCCRSRCIGLESSSSLWSQEASPPAVWVGGGGEGGVGGEAAH